LNASAMDETTKQFPEGMTPLGESGFSFDCNPGVDCFTLCCKNVDLTLYPYDIIRLKSFLAIDSQEFLRNHTFLQKGANPYFPTVKLKLLENTDKSCPFLIPEGCSVYKERPFSCRTYPLEVAVDRSCFSEPSSEYFFLTNHDYCLGHRREKVQTVREWVRSQRLHDCLLMNGLWTEMDTIFAGNPWKGEGYCGQKQQLAFMACYNIDGFRRFASEQHLLQQFKLDRDFKKRILNSDTELQKFAFEWLKLILGERSSLVKR